MMKKEESQQETRKCKNKKCQRPLPIDYKHKYCENCRNEHVQSTKNIGKGVLGFALLVGGTIITVATKGKINPNDKS